MKGLSVLKYIYFHLLISLAFPLMAHAEIFVHDAVAMSRAETTIKAETKGRYFTVKGGQSVAFSVNRKAVGSVLSGGDGIAYKEFRTGPPGVYPVTASHGKETDRGNILVLGKGSGIVFIDIEGSLLAGPFSRKPIENSRNVIRTIIKKYPIVYLHTGEYGAKHFRAWLRDNSFPESAVMPWQMGDIFREVAKKGLKIKAVIGAQAVVESADSYMPQSFVIDAQDGSRNAQTWKEIEKKLR